MISEPRSDFMSPGVLSFGVTNSGFKTLSVLGSGDYYSITRSDVIIELTLFISSSIYSVADALRSSGFCSFSIGSFVILT